MLLRKLLTASLPLLLSVLALTTPCAWAQTGEGDAHATAAAQTLAATWDAHTGLFQGTGWWNSANGITVLVNVDRDVPGNDHAALFTTTLTAAQGKFPGFLNEFYDDEGWWALAWLDAYQLHKDPHTLMMSKAIFANMTGGWSDTCGGGIWWKKNERYKNAIANELFLSVATGLAGVSKGKARRVYSKWAQKEADWFLGSGMINSDGLVNDGLDSNCRNNGRTTWSYNQGVLLTGLAQLSTLRKDPRYMESAHRVAAAALAHLTDTNGILHDPCEPNCGADGVQFKGIFVRNLRTLNGLAPSAAYTRFLAANAGSVWANARTAAGQFSVDWAGPPQDSGTGSLISALDALAAAAPTAGVPR